MPTPPEVVFRPPQGYEPPFNNDQNRTVTPCFKGRFRTLVYKTVTFCFKSGIIPACGNLLPPAGFVSFIKSEIIVGQRSVFWPVLQFRVTRRKSGHENVTLSSPNREMGISTRVRLPTGL